MDLINVVSICGSNSCATVAHMFYLVCVGAPQTVFNQMFGRTIASACFLLFMFNVVLFLFCICAKGVCQWHLCIVRTRDQEWFQIAQLVGPCGSIFGLKCTSECCVCPLNFRMFMSSQMIGGHLRLSTLSFSALKV